MNPKKPYHRKIEVHALEFAVLQFLIGLEDKFDSVSPYSWPSMWRGVSLYIGKIQDRGQASKAVMVEIEVVCWPKNSSIVCECVQGVGEWRITRGIFKKIPLGNSPENIYFYHGHGSEDGGLTFALKDDVVGRLTLEKLLFGA